MKKLVYIFAVSVLCVVLMSCNLFNDDEEEEYPDYPFSVRPYKSTEAFLSVEIGYDPVVYIFESGDGLSDGSGFLRFEAKNIGDEKLCSVTCTITATSKTGYARADVAWEPYVGAAGTGDVKWVKEEWDKGEQFYGIATFTDISDEELDFEYSFGWAECVDESSGNLGGIVAPPRQ